MEENINIFDELKSLAASTLISISRNNVYFLPDNYFSSLIDNIKRQIWLNSVPVINPYSVPSNYFEYLPDLILDKLSIQNQFVVNRQTYEAPEGYFDNLAASILQNIKAKNNVHQELEELSPLLSEIPKTNVYTVPDLYFESLIQVPAQEIQPAKVISIKNKPRRWIAYAAAACIAVLMFGGGYYYMQDNTFNNNSSSSTVQNQLAGVKVKQAISQLSDAEIDSYLNNNNYDVYTPQSDTQDINIKSLLENMSDEEINNYLRENSDPGENTRGI